MCGRLRPDFLARCEPNADITINEPVVVPYGQDVSYRYPCTNTNDSELEDGYKSFPSGEV